MKHLHTFSQHLNESQYPSLPPDVNKIKPEDLRDTVEKWCYDTLKFSKEEIQKLEYVNGLMDGVFLNSKGYILKINKGHEAAWLPGCTFIKKHEYYGMEIRIDGRYQLYESPSIESLLCVFMGSFNIKPKWIQIK